MQISKNDFQNYIRNFQFGELFIELGWNHVVKKQSIAVDGEVFNLEAVAEKKDFVIFVCPPQSNGQIPDSNIRKKIENRITKFHFEHLLIFIDQNKSKQIWQISIREPYKPIVVRDITHHKHQEPELLIQKLKGLIFTIDEEEKIGLVDVKQRISASFQANTEKVTKQFYDKFKTQHRTFLDFIQGIDETVNKEWYASLMLNRLMFIYFIQKKGFLDDNVQYLKEKLKEVTLKKGKDKFYSFYKNFLLILFHKGLGTPDHSQEIKELIGTVPYLNGGLFDVHELEQTYSIDIPDEAFEKLFAFFDQYNWHLDINISASGKDINPDVIGYIFEKYINDRAAMGAYYTKEDITEYISKNTIIPFLFDKVKKECTNAFREESSLWKMLSENPDKYIYAAVRHGVYACTEQSRSEGVDQDFQDYGITTKVCTGLPKDVSIGVDTEKPNLLERRKNWNQKAPQNIALPTEIFREVIERRKRYWEIREKIEKGEIREINDFITYNLDIRQFAQDAVTQYEGSDFINAFYKAITEISILDPTCGSGAFLFAALNILEPLYETCLDRMQEFVELDDLKGGKKHINFRKILKDIDHHLNRKYFIFKSIILKNLHGVDIMNEAVEIAKLRLFLKLVAEVDVDYSKDNLGLEPLPDIDFNIRSGNTLVGFAKLEEVKDAVGQISLLDTDFLERIKEQSEYVQMAYRAFHETSIENDDSIKEVKKELNEKLKKLNDELDIYQAHLYGIDAKLQPEKFIQWKGSHQPFHWFAEFYDIIQVYGGFDVIIGNPPYVEYTKIKSEYEVKGFLTENCGNIFAFVFENAFLLTHQYGKIGFIVPISLISTERMNALQHILNKGSKSIWLNTYDVYPQKLFTGAKQRLTICIYACSKNQNEINSTKYTRWKPEERDNLFSKINYQSSSLQKELSSIPKLSNFLMAEIFFKIITFNPITYKKNSYTPSFYVHRIPYNYVKSFNFIPYFWNSIDGEKKSEDYKPYFLKEREFDKTVLSLLNSNLFFLWWYLLYEGYHCGKHEIYKFPVGIDKMTINIKHKLDNLADLLMKDIKRNSVRKQANYKSTGDVEYEEFYPKKSKNIIDEIDNVLAEHYGFTEEELDFIINYDIKYRMGDSLNNVGE